MLEHSKYIDLKKVNLFLKDHDRKQAYFVMFKEPFISACLAFEVS